MERSELLGRIDHTQLKAVCTWEDIRKLCDEALLYHTASVCIPPAYVKEATQTYGEKLNICTVIGFPLGYQTTASKVFEAKDAIANGAKEIDMVIHIGAVKSGRYEKVEEEIKALKEAVGDHILKVIIETCYLTEEEKIRLCQIVTRAGADYIKTSTGFGTGGAVMEDILLFKQHIGGQVKIKAAGGVKTLQDMEDFVNAGCSRIGTSSGVSMIVGE